MFTKTPLSQQLQLTVEEKNLLAAILEDVKADPLSTSYMVSKFDPELIYKLTDNNKELRLFCQNYRYKNYTPHLEAWAKVLRDNHHPGVELESLDTKKTLSIFDQYRSLYLYAEAKHYEKDKGILSTIFLNEACGYGFLFALMERCVRNMAILRDPKIGDKNKKADAVITDAVTEITMDAKTMSHLYWTLGFAFSAKILMMLGQYYDSTGLEEHKAVAKTHYTKAVKNLCYAKSLERIEVSNAILDAYCKDDNLFSYVFGKDRAYKNWEEAEKEFMVKFIGNDQEALAQLKETVRQELERIFSKKSNVNDFD